MCMCVCVHAQLWVCASGRMLVYIHGEGLRFSRCFGLYTGAKWMEDAVKNEKVVNTSAQVIS